MPGIVVDIGTGDGAFVYELARAHPDRLFIGIDPNHKGMEKLSAKALAKPAKGGLKNVLFVLARIEDLPDELDGMANQVFINFPWAGLLKGIVTANPATWSNIRRICQTGAFVDMLFGYQDNLELREIQQRNLPELNESLIAKSLTDNLIHLGFELIELSPVAGNQLKNYPTSWSKRLGYGRERLFYYLRVQAV